MEAESDGYLGRTPVPPRKSVIWDTHTAHFQGISITTFQLELVGPAWRKWAQSRRSNSKHPKNSSNLKNPGANQSHPLTAWME